MIITKLPNVFRRKKYLSLQVSALRTNNITKNKARKREKKVSQHHVDEGKDDGERGVTHLPSQTTARLTIPEPLSVRSTFSDIVHTCNSSSQIHLSKLMSQLSKYLRLESPQYREEWNFFVKQCVSRNSKQ